MKWGKWAETYERKGVEKKELGSFLSNLLLAGTGEVGCVLDERCLWRGDVGPQVGGQEAVCLGDSLERSLDEVTHGGSLAGRLCVAVLNTGELEHSLGGGGSNDTSTSWGGDKSAHDRGGLAGNLHGNGVGLTESGTPVSSSDWDDRELGKDDGGTDGSCDFLGALDTETKVTVTVTDGNESLESGTLTGTGLLLNGHDLHDLVLELREEEVDDLVLLDGEGEEVDLLDGLDLSVLDQSANSSDGD